MGAFGIPWDVFTTTLDAFGTSGLLWGALWQFFEASALKDEARTC